MKKSSRNPDLVFFIVIVYQHWQKLYHCESIQWKFIVNFHFNWFLYELCQTINHLCRIGKCSSKRLRKNVSNFSSFHQYFLGVILCIYLKVLVSNVAVYSLATNFVGKLCFIFCFITQIKVHFNLSANV